MDELKQVRIARAKRARSAGHGWEKDTARTLRDRHIYPEVITTRQGSRFLDGLGIDLMNRDEGTQGIMIDTISCKTTIAGINYHELLTDLEKSGRPGRVVFHRRTYKADKKIMVKGHYCTTDLDNYLELMACRQAIKRIMSLDSTQTNQTLLGILRELGL